jgi:hypothetical protein
MFHISSVCVLIFLVKTDMYPKGSPKYNITQKSALGVKRNSPKMRKGRSPTGNIQVNLLALFFYWFS